MAKQDVTVTREMIVAAARVIAWREESNAGKWPKYVATAEAALRAGLAAAGAVE